MSATVPATNGLAMLVPESVLYSLAGSFQVLRIPDPGAATWFGSVLRWLVAAMRSGAASVSTATKSIWLPLPPSCGNDSPAPLSGQVLATVSVPNTPGLDEPVAAKLA